MIKASPNSICVLRLSAIGDVCHALATVQLIQRTYPDTKITWIMGKIEAQLLGDLPDVEVVVFDKSQGLQGMKAVWRQLAGRKFDYLLHMQVALRASVLTLGIKAKVKLGFSWKRAKEGQWLFTNRKLPNSHSSHVLDNFADFAGYLGCQVTDPSWFIPTEPSPLPLQATPYVVISPAASKDERNWLSERYAAIADYAVEKGYHVVLCGSPAERERKLALDIVSQCREDTQKQLIDLVGKTNLKQLCSVLKQAELVIAPDSGPAHIATTQGTPVIGLYAHSNPQRTGPYNSLHWVVSVYDQVVQEQYGKPVSELKWATRVKGKNLMERITLDQVQKTFDAIVDN
ncbi:glycosyltransferase family 9 protein [Vibrio hippocampi]|uniref:Lipopolysaccharide heptosyltransferase 1 n=1 Tax=Vibrio hippocampi TaxID=654686 RepID=A0ABM8ZLN7_9VIBR|nr:glycosyltransferase family 9 protein [Vibrio hippocampi]CAH0528970.1 Lipopolysaccharide heptosyltransferase 1 [Vibrio hippocampi]